MPHLRRLVRAARDAQRLDQDPLERLIAPRFRRGQRTAFRAASVARLVDAIRSAPCRWDARERDVAIVQFLFATGLRRAELARLRAGDIDFAARLCAVDGKTGHRRLPISALAIAAAQTLFRGCAPDETCVRSVRAIELAFARIVARTGIAVSPHRLRHGFASELAAAGVDPFVLRDLLGHRGIAASLHYVHLHGERSRAAVESIERALQGHIPSMP